MADYSPQFSNNDDEIAEPPDLRTGAPIQRTTTAEWVLGARILAGAPLLYYGITHSQDPALMRNMLIASQAPAVGLLTIALPALEVLVGAVMLAGAYARIAAGGGLVLGSTMFWLVWTVITLRDGYLPPGITEPPPTPSLPMPLVIIVANAIILFLGAGPVSVDEQMTRPEPPPPPDPNAPPTGII